MRRPFKLGSRGGRPTLQKSHTWLNVSRYCLLLASSSSTTRGRTPVLGSLIDRARLELELEERVSRLERYHKREVFSDSVCVCGGGGKEGKEMISRWGRRGLCFEESLWLRFDSPLLSLDLQQE